MDGTNSAADHQAASTRRRPFTQRLQEPGTALDWGTGSTSENWNADGMEVSGEEKQMSERSAM